MTLDLTQIRSRAEHAERWVQRDPCNADGFLLLSFREHFNHDMPALIAEVERLRAVAWQIHNAMTDQHAETEHILWGDCAQCEKAAEEMDSQFCCEGWKRRQKAYSDALGLVIGEKP